MFIHLFRYIDQAHFLGAIQIRPSSDPSFRYEPCGSHVSDNIENLVDLDELSEGMRLVCQYTSQASIIVLKVIYCY